MTKGKAKKNVDRIADMSQEGYYLWEKVHSSIRYARIEPHALTLEQLAGAIAAGLKDSAERKALAELIMEEAQI